MKLINFEDVSNLKIPPEQLYSWVEEMLMQKHSAILPPKISMTQAENGFCNVMPCVLPNEDVMGVKVVTRYPRRTPALSSQIILYRQGSGEPLALMDGTYITAMRTGAVAAHSIKTFAKSDFSSVGFIGLGNTARATLHVFASLDKDVEYTIGLLSYKDHAQSFKDRFKEHKNLVFTVYDNARALIGDSDVTVSCVTYTDTLFADDESYRPGCTIIPVHTRGFQNCDLFFDKVFADDRDHVKGFQHFGRFRNFAETSTVLAGKEPGRNSNGERILIYNIGLSIHDVYFAHKVYQLLGNLPNSIKLADPTEKFWV